MLKQSLIIYAGFGCCASVSGVIGDYAVQNFLKWGNVRVAYLCWPLNTNVHSTFINFRLMA